MPDVPLSPDERRAEFLRVQLALSLQAMRGKLHQEVDFFIREVTAFLNNPLRAILESSQMTPAEAGEVWREQVVQAKARLQERLEEQFLRVRQPSADLLMLLAALPATLPPMPEDDSELQAIMRKVQMQIGIDPRGTSPRKEEGVESHPF